jgi:H+/Cl- antiporter ClcA
LDEITYFRDYHLCIGFCLPIIGFAIGVIYHFFGRGLGMQPILNAALVENGRISWKTAPFVFIGTLLTHLGGGSAGREGAAIQVSAGLADAMIPRFVKLNCEERKTIVQAALGAGFGSAIGAPIAGFFFSLELFRFRRLNGIWECLVAAFVAHFISIILHAPHTYFPKLNPSWLGWKFLLALLLLGLTAGGVIRTYLITVEWLERKLDFCIMPFRTFSGGLIICLGFYFLGGRYLGLGIPAIQESFLVPSPIFDPFLKGLFTLVTLVSGFKGGEFVPFIFMGTTLGSSISPWFPGSLPLLPAIGFPVFFAAASKTPMSCTILAIEIFGFVTGIYALPVCLVASFISGKRSIYALRS